MLDVRHALARELGRPDLVKVGRLVRKSDDGRMSSLLEREVVGSLRFGDQVLFIGADLSPSGVKKTEVLRHMSVGDAKAHAPMAPWSPLCGGAPADDWQTRSKASPKIGDERAVATPQSVASPNKATEAPEMPVPDEDVAAEGASDARRPQLHFGYVCPDCGVSGLPDLASASRHCGGVAEPLLARRSTGSPSSRFADVAARFRQSASQHFCDDSATGKASAGQLAAGRREVEPRSGSPHVRVASATPDQSSDDSALRPAPVAQSDARHERENAAGDGGITFAPAPVDDFTCFPAPPPGPVLAAAAALAANATRAQPLGRTNFVPSQLSDAAHVAAEAAAVVAQRAAEDLSAAAALAPPTTQTAAAASPALATATAASAVSLDSVATPAFVPGTAASAASSDSVATPAVVPISGSGAMSSSAKAAVDGAASPKARSVAASTVAMEASASAPRPLAPRLAAWGADANDAGREGEPLGATIAPEPPERMGRAEAVGDGGGAARLVVGTNGVVPTAAPLKGEPVAYSEFGFPTIVRQVDDGTGQARTIVQNEDGSHKVFGANTVSSLTGSSVEDAKRWLNALRDREMHGLVHELGKRLVGASQQYQHQREQLEQLAHRGHYEYFGLQQGASEKELQAAYRRMAKRMHPDKNGGTEDAKRKFQHMKERYESLKERFRPIGSTVSTAASRDEAPAEEPEESQAEEEGAENDEGEPQTGASGSGSSGSVSGDEGEAANDDGDDARSPTCRSRKKHRLMDRRGRNKSPRSGSSVSTVSPKRRGADGTPGGERRREAYDEDDVDGAHARSTGAEADGGRIAYDPSDRSSMDGTCWKMVEQMRRLQQGLESVRAELRRAGGP